MLKEKHREVLEAAIEVTQHNSRGLESAANRLVRKEVVEASLQACRGVIARLGLEHDDRHAWIVKGIPGDRAFVVTGLDRGELGPILRRRCSRSRPTIAPAPIERLESTVERAPIWVGQLLRGEDGGPP